jgi:hypothetical protein
MWPRSSLFGTFLPFEAAPETPFILTHSIATRLKFTYMVGDSINSASYGLGTSLSDDRFVASIKLRGCLVE